MRLLCLLFALYGFTTFAQPVTVKIDALVAKETTPQEREYKLTYRVINNTADTLKLFFKSSGLLTTDEDHNAKMAYYKIYEGDSYINIGAILRTKGTSIGRFEFKEEDVMQSQEDFEKIYISFLSKQYETQLDSIQNLYKKEGYEGLLKWESQQYFTLLEKRKMHYQVLMPHQQLECTATLYWNKKRYYYSEPHELYLDENIKYHMEITLVALKEELKDKIEEQLYAKIKDDPNLIKGVFVSNKVEINF